MASTLITVALIGLLAAMTPGPNLIATVAISVKSNRLNALTTVLGIMLGIGIWGTLSLLGVSALFALAPWLYIAMKTAGGSYLIFIGIKMLRSNKQRFTLSDKKETSDIQVLRHLRLGALTSLSNPKTVLFMSSIFSVTLGQDYRLIDGVVVMAVLMTIGAAFYALIAIVVTSHSVTHGMAKFSSLAEKICGGLFVMFGTKIVFTQSSN